MTHYWLTIMSGISEHLSITEVMDYWFHGHGIHYVISVLWNISQISLKIKQFLSLRIERFIMIKSTKEILWKLQYSIPFSFVLFFASVSLVVKKEPGFVFSVCFLCVCFLSFLLWIIGDGHESLFWAFCLFYCFALHICSFDFMWSPLLLLDYPLLLKSNEN